MSLLGGQTPAGMPDPTNPLIVQSDLTVLLETAAPRAAEARGALSRFAELDKAPEHIQTYKITPLTLWNAAASGLTAAEATTTLNGFAKYPVPPAVLTEVAEQMSRYGRLRLVRDFDSGGLAITTGEPSLLDTLVAHDRVFLNNVATRVFEVQSGVACFEGNYEDYVEARDERIAQQQREHAKADERMAQAKATILQFRKQKRFDGQYASRMKALEKYQAALDKTPDAQLESFAFGLRFGARDKSSEEMLRFSGLTKAYDRQVLQGAELELRRGDRVGLVGGNGAGKSTLLRILTGRETKDAGELHAAPGVQGVFFSQEQDDLRAERTLHQEVLDARPDMEERDVKALLGRFRFHPDVDLARNVASLSGGERQRLMLLKCVLRPSNLLILDEPTNHLDLWARDVVVQALNAYHGTLLVVSHDRYLLDATTDVTAVLDEGRIHAYPGSFTQSRDEHAARKKQVVEVRYVVRKKFTDWNTNTKFRAGDEPQLTEAQIRASMTLRNALAQGWLERA